MLRVGPPHDSGATPQEIRNPQLEMARRQGWPELDLADLVDGRFGILEHRPTGDYFVLRRGQIDDAVYGTAAAFFVDDAGAIRFLERPSSGPRNRAGREQHGAEREQRHNAPKPRRQAAPR